MRFFATLDADVLEALDVFESYQRPPFYAVGCAESDLTADALGDLDLPTGPAFGGWQLERPWFDGTAYPTVAAFPDAWKASLVGNARGARIVHLHQGFNAWSTWHHGGRTAEGTLAWARAHGNCLP